ncbi:MAG: hypothetical protein ACREI3_09455, partial [Nitrospirales bacterium]
RDPFATLGPKGTRRAVTDNSIESPPPLVAEALHALGLTLPVTRDRLDERRRELLLTWHPHRYANLTNNPRRYMQMYKKGEAMTREINSAYEVVLAWLSESESR